MAKKIKISQNAFWHLTGCEKFFKDFAVTFAYAFRYYITGLIFGYFLCMIVRKCFSWTFDRAATNPLETQSEDPNDEFRLQEDAAENKEDEDGDRKLRKANSSDCSKLDGASRNLETLPAVRERHSSLDYWKSCFDNFGFVVVDTLNPVVPFRRFYKTGNTNVPQRSPITLRWIPNSNKSSSTTDIESVTRQNETKHSQVRPDELKYRNIQDSCVDTHDLEDHHALKRVIPKRHNKKLDTFGLRSVELDESDSVLPYKIPKNNVVLSITKKLSTTDLNHSIESSLIPGQKVSKNAVIVLRLRDKQLSPSNVFDEEVVSLPSKGKKVGSRKKINKASHSEKRRHRDNLKLPRDKGYVVSSDENSLGSLEDNKKKRNLLSFTKCSMNHLHNPFSKKAILSDDRCRKKVGSKKSFKHSTDVWRMGNQESLIRKSSKQSRSNKEDQTLRARDSSNRRCFRYKKPSLKRQKIVQNPSKSQIRSISRFLSDLRKSNTSNSKQSTAKIWSKNNPLNNENIYQIQVKKSVSELLSTSSSKYRFSEDTTVSDEVEEMKSVEGFHSKVRNQIAEPRASRSRYRISETGHHSESEQVCHTGRLFGNSTVSMGITNKQASSVCKGKSKELIVTNYSDISTGSESISGDELNCPLPEDRKASVGADQVEQLIVAVGENCNKNCRGQFWKIFGSRSPGKTT